MAMPSDPDDEDWTRRKDRVIGLGDRSFRKSYYPQLRQNLERLERFRTLLDHTADSVILLDLTDGTVVDANAAVERLFGEPLAALIGRPFSALGLNESEKFLDDLRQQSGITGEKEGITSLVLPFGAIWLELTGRTAWLEGRVYGVLVARDVTERRRQEAVVSDLLAEKKTILENSVVGIVMMRHRRIVTCNRRFEEIFGYPPGAMIGQSARILYSSDEIFMSLGAESYPTIGRGLTFSATLDMARADGSTFWGEVTGRAVDPARPQDGSIWIYNDVSERKAAEQRVHFLAHFDALTGLPNRTHLNDRAKYALSLAQRNQTSLAVMFLDLDHFKDINDTLGHSVGDALLVDLAKRLGLVLREEDTVARLGGDEFIFLLYGIDARGAAMVAKKLLATIAEPFRVDQYDLNITGSMGIAIYPDDGKDLETLSKNADVAMYRAKQEGRQGFCYFTAEMQQRSARHLSLVNALRLALERDQLSVHFQPQIAINNGAIVGAEALLRWTHPALGRISPAEFIPAAEESGLIMPIGEWVLRHAVRQAKYWLQDGLPPLVMAVNLSAIQFRHPDLPDLVSRILDEEGLAPEYLELELTEGVAMHDPKGVIAIMHDLHERGVRMSIDDFGTGYSSLSYLKKFKVYKLKIDQSFVRDISTDAEDKAIVGAVIRMSQSLGLLTIAEGVETPAQLAFLREQGCDEVQGYYYSKPLPATDFAAFMAARPGT